MKKIAMCIVIFAFILTAGPLFAAKDKTGKAKPEAKVTQPAEKKAAPAPKTPEPAPAPTLTMQQIAFIVETGVKAVRNGGYTVLGVDWNNRAIWIEKKCDPPLPGTVVQEQCRDQVNIYSLQPIIDQVVKSMAQKKAGEKK
jgi:hypothetical protein